MILLKAILLSILPVSELRGGILFAISNNVDPFLAYLLCVLANISVFFIVFLFLNSIHKYLLKSNHYERLFLRYLEKSKKKFEKHVGTNLEFIMLLLFVAVPLPLTGAYTGSLIAWLFKLEQKKAFLAVSLGVIIAGILVTLAGIGLFKLI